MPSTGWITAGAGANNADAGTTAWTDPGNITVATDDAYAIASSVAKSGGTTQYLHATSFDFSALPSSLTVDGVQARLRYGNAASVTFHTVQLIVGGSRTGSNLADATAMTSGVSTTDYGGTSNLWGLSLSRADVVSSSFGLAVRCTNPAASWRSPRVYYVQIDISYTEITGNPGAFFALFSVKDRLREILKPKRQFWLPEPGFICA